MSGFKVSGTLDGALYEVEVTGNAAAPTVGSRRVAALVEDFVGETVLVTPAGPAFTVSPKDPASILALLSAETRVTAIGPGAPELLDPLPPGTVR